MNYRALGVEALGMWDKLVSVLLLHQLLMTWDTSLPHFGLQFPCLDNEGVRRGSLYSSSLMSCDYKIQGHSS